MPEYCHSDENIREEEGDSSHPFYGNDSPPNLANISIKERDLSSPWELFWDYARWRAG